MVSNTEGGIQETVHTTKPGDWPWLSALGEKHNSVDEDWSVRKALFCETAWVGVACWPSEYHSEHGTLERVDRRPMILCLALNVMTAPGRLVMHAYFPRTVGDSRLGPTRRIRCWPMVLAHIGNRKDWQIQEQELVRM